MNLAQVDQGLWQDLIVCNGPDCNFGHLIQLVRVIMNNLIVVALVASTIAFVWVGFTLLTSQGDPGAMKEAKEIGRKVVLGLIFVLAGWLIVYTITSVLLSRDPGFTLLESIQR